MSALAHPNLRYCDVLTATDPRLVGWIAPRGRVRLRKASTILTGDTVRTVESLTSALNDACSHGSGHRSDVSSKKSSMTG